MGRAHARVFLLGAGFARAILPAMPLLQDLAVRTRDAVGGGCGIPPEVQTMMEDDFAHALSYLEQAKPWLTGADNLRHRALFLDFSNAIARSLDETVAEAARQLATNVPDWLVRLVRHWHENRCTVITLNYDTLIETIAGAVEFPGETRLTAADLYPLMLTDAGVRSGGLAPRERVETFRLLKLHGSTNWYYSGTGSAHGEPIYFVPPFASQEDGEDIEREHEQRLRAVADKYPFLVPPIYDKSPLLTHETIRALWFEAGEALQRAREIVCMGYSLPDSDLTMMHFLRTTAAAQARLLVVNQSGRALENFKKLFRNTEVEIALCGSGPSCIAEYVDSLEAGPEKARRSA